MLKMPEGDGSWFIQLVTQPSNLLGWLNKTGLTKNNAFNEASWASPKARRGKGESAGWTRNLTRCRKPGQKPEAGPRRKPSSKLWL